MGKKKNPTTEVVKEKPTTRLTRNIKTDTFDVFSLHSTDTNVTDGVDIIEELVRADITDNPNSVSTTAPSLKIKCLLNLHAEMRNIQTNRRYENERGKRFQIIKRLLSQESLVQKITACSLGIAKQKGSAWTKHGVWTKYNFDMKAYSDSLVSFVTFFRNHHIHFYETPSDFKLLVRCERIDDSRFCLFINNKFPAILNFLFTLYLAACDERDEMRKIFPSYSENADLLLFEDLESFLSDTLTKNFPKFSGKFLRNLDIFLRRHINFDKDGNFVSIP
jgi:hypothetical protein